MSLPLQLSSGPSALGDGSFVGNGLRLRGLGLRLSRSSPGGIELRVEVVEGTIKGKGRGLVCLLWLVGRMDVSLRWLPTRAVERSLLKRELERLGRIESPEFKEKLDMDMRNMAWLVSSFVWGLFVATLMYGQALYCFVVVAIYAGIFIFFRSAKVRQGAAWSIVGVAFWYAFYWCVLQGGPFH